MAISIKNTARDVVSCGVKILTYGQAGAGKTFMVSTAPNPLVISAEGGLLSLAGKDIPYIEIHDIATLYETYQWLMQSDEVKAFDTICVDSISEIAEVILADEKERNKDPRKAYGEMADSVTALVRKFRDLPGKHVYISAKLEMRQDDMGAVVCQPSIPGTKVGPSLPYFFDEVFALRTTKDSDGVHRWLQTTADGIWVAKDRSGRLDPGGEPADLAYIIDKIAHAAKEE